MTLGARQESFVATAKVCLLFVVWLTTPILLMQALPLALPWVPPLNSVRVVKAPVIGVTTLLLTDIVVHKLSYSIRPLTPTRWEFSNLECEVSMRWTTTPDDALPILSGALTAGVSTGGVIPFCESAPVHVETLHVDCLGYDVERFLPDALVHRMVQEDVDKADDLLSYAIVRVYAILGVAMVVAAWHTAFAGAQKVGAAKRAQAGAGAR